VGVSDRNAITVLTDGRESIWIRLAEIDAPEKSQAFGQCSKPSLLGYGLWQDRPRGAAGIWSLWAWREARLRWRNRFEYGVGTPGNGVGLPPICSGRMSTDARVGGQRWPGAACGPITIQRLPGGSGIGRETGSHRPLG